MEIYVAYAEANGHATEALSNVRTVKAMSTEHQGNKSRRLLGTSARGRTVGLRLAVVLLAFRCCGACRWHHVMRAKAPPPVM